MTTKDAKTTKDALDKALITYKCSKLAVSNNIAKKDTVSDRIFQNKLKKLEDDLYELNICHTAWVAKAEPEAEVLNAYENNAFSIFWLADL